jgi:hypothetical protein
MSKSHYELLELSRNATEDQIRKAFRQKIKKYHPDLNPNKQEAELRSRELNLALEVLTNPQKRESYDLELDLEREIESGEQYDFSAFTNQHTTPVSPLQSSATNRRRRKNNSKLKQQLPLYVGFGFIGLVALVGLTVLAATLTKSAPDGLLADSASGSPNSSTGSFSLTGESVEWDGETALVKRSLGSFMEFEGELSVPNNCKLLMEPKTFEDFANPVKPTAVSWEPKFCFTEQDLLMPSRWNLKIDSASIKELAPVTETRFKSGSDIEFTKGVSPHFIVMATKGAEQNYSEVFDLTTGKAVGKFSTRMNSGGELSVDAKHYVCFSGEKRTERSFGKVKFTPGEIQVWQSEKLDEPVCTIPLKRDPKDTKKIVCINESVFAILYKSTKSVTVDFYEFGIAERKNSVSLEDQSFILPTGIGAAISPDRNHFAVATSESVYLLSAAALDIVGSYPGKASAIRFGAKGKKLFILAGNLTVWSVETGALLEAHDPKIPSGRRRDRLVALGNGRLLLAGDMLVDTLSSEVWDCEGIWHVEGLSGEETESRTIGFHGDTPLQYKKEPNNGSFVLRTNEIVEERLVKLKQELKSAVATIEVEEAKIQKPVVSGKWKQIRLKPMEKSRGEGRNRKPWPANLAISSGSFGVSLEEDQNRHFFQRWNLDSGEPVGSPVEFGSCGSEYVGSRILKLIPISVSMDGKHVAVSDSNEKFKNVTVHDSNGKAILRFRPYRDGFVEWVGFNSAGQLLTIGAGKLVAWNIPDGKPVYCIDGEYRSTVFQLLHEDLLVVSAGNHCDILDAKTGQCTNRHAGVADELIVDILVSPERKRLYTLGVPIEDFANAKNNTQPRQLAQQSPGERRRGKVELARQAIRSCSLVARNLVNGKASSINFPEPLSLREIADSEAWLHPRLCLLESQYVGIVNAAGFDHVIENETDGILVFSGELSAIIGPDRQACKRSNGKLVPAPREDWASPMHLHRPRVKLSRELPVAVKVNGMNRQQNGMAAEAVARKLEEQGFNLGTDGLTIEIEAQVSKSGTKVQFKHPGSEEDGDSPSDLDLPQVDFAWTVKDQYGGVVKERKSHARFSFHGSRFFSSNKGTEIYCFESSDPFEEVATEIVSQETGLEVDFMPSHVAVSTRPSS